MKKKSQSFGSFFLSAARSSGATLPVRLIWAAVLAAVLSCFVLVLPKVAPTVSAKFPRFTFDTAAGAAHLYTVAASTVIMLCRVFGPKLFIFDEILSGKWELASRCGANLRKPCLAKALFAFWAPLSTYCFGAVIFCLIVRFAGGSLFEGFNRQIGLFMVGLLSMVLMFSLEIIFAAFGAQKGGLPFICLPFFILIIVYWYWKGLLAANNTEGMTIVSVENILKFSPTSLTLIAPAAFLLAMLICMTVPIRRIDRYVVEDLDDEMLRILEFRGDQEVYEKTSDGFELVFTGKEVLKSK
ncbi:MAG: hypothetical protein J5744_05610 [Oscillospiraceae bacterium]|nr:hypothetical protein [Oscillospiraceae bacterium]